MADTVAIHIGQPKAASTALQRTLSDARIALAQHDIHYPLRDGATEHIAEFADLLLQWIRPGSDNTRAHARMAHIAVPGSWEALKARTRDLRGHVLVSDETLCEFSSGAANHVVSSLSEGRPERVAVVVVVRPVHGLLPSIYGQMARDSVLPSFENWLRASLAMRLSARAGAHDEHWSALVPNVVDIWHSTGAEVRMVPYGTDADFGARLSAALGIARAVPSLQLQRANVSLGAATIAAWQRCLRAVGVKGFDPHAWARLKRWRKSTEAMAFEAASGRLTLTAEVCELVDAAFPSLSPGALEWPEATEVERAKAALRARLADTAPMTGPPPDPALVSLIYESMRDHLAAAGSH
jgi:hypothetical protein